MKELGRAYDGGRGIAPPGALIAGAAVIVLSAVLTVSGISRLFSFATPAPGLLLAALGIAALAMVWFEAVKRHLGPGLRLEQR